MRFERILVRRFGRLAEFDTGDEPLTDLVVVHGPNEAGKSTLFHFLVTLLYGFSPASSNRHMYAPWSGDDIDGEGVIRLSSGEQVRVHRRLLSSPWGRLYRDGSESDLRNGPLPWTGSVHPAVFEHVYALRLADLARMQEDAWHRIQDRLLGSMGAADLRPARVVAAELEEAAARLWRPDRRASPRARQLLKELGRLRQARLDALDRDATMRRLARELGELESELVVTRDERTELKVLIDRITVLLPVRQHLARIEELEREAGDAAELDGLPESPGRALETLEAEVSRLEEESQALADRRARLEATAAAFTESDAALLERAAAIRELVRRSGGIRESMARLGSAENELERLAQACELRSREIFSGDWSELDSGRIRAVPLGELRERVRSHREANEELGRRDANLAAMRALAASGARRSALDGRVLPVAGGAMAIAGVVTGSGVVLAVAAAVMVLAVLALWTARRSAVEHAATLRQAQEARDAVAREAEASRLGVARVLEGLPVAAALLERPGPELVQSVESLGAALAELEAAQRQADALRASITDAEERLSELAALLHVEVPGDFVAGALGLESALRDAEARGAAAKAARDELRELQRAESASRGRHEELGGRRDRLRDRLAGLGGGDVARGGDVAAARLALRRRAAELRDELERRHPDLAELKARIRAAEDDGEDWTRDADAHIRAGQRVETLDERERELIVEIGDRRHALAQLEREHTLDHIEGAIDAVRDELDAVSRRRDRLALLARLVRRADSRFRDKNQPDLLRRAGEHLGRITGGRYGRLELPEEQADGSLLLHAPGRTDPVVAAEPVSSGTRDQVYLAIRLAIIDHLDADGERLPLFIDEAFVNWDAARLERGLELLAGLARERQIFLFTCHDTIAAPLQERGARVLRLSRPD